MEILGAALGISMSHHLNEWVKLLWFGGRNDWGGNDLWAKQLGGK